MVPAVGHVYAFVFAFTCITITVACVVAAISAVVCTFDDVGVCIALSVANKIIRAWSMHWYAWVFTFFKISLT